MATDYFCKMEGIPGESTDSKHPQQIELESFQVGASQGAMTAVSGRGGQTGERVSLDQFTITKVLDSSSPILFKYCCTGTSIPTVTIEVCGANAEKTTYLTYVMTNVVIGHISTNGHGTTGGVRPTETVGLRYSKIQITYTPYDNTGKAGAAVKAGWDAAQNAVV